jgi:hypothetical protein
VYVGLFLVVLIDGFSVQPNALARRRSSLQQQHTGSILKAFNNKNSDDNDRNNNDNEGVNVNLIPDVDSVTLTAIGFGLIAFNFFVLANLGDGGIGGTVAKLINLMKE